MSSYVSRVALTEQVYNHILEGIFDQTYRPGQLLNINHLASELGVSSTPIREALSRLASGRIVELSSFKGFRVAREMGVDDVEKLFDIRVLLETYAVRHHPLSAPQHIAELEATITEMRKHSARDTDYASEAFILDRRFHRLLIEATGNQFLVSAYESLDSHIHIARLYLKNHWVGGVQPIVDEHTAILEAYCQGDAEQTAAMLRSHLNSARDRLVSQLADG